MMKVLLLILITIVNSTLGMNDLNIRITKRFFNDKFFPYLNCQVPLQIFYGGASSGKSVFAAQRRVIAMVREPRNYLVVRDVANTIRSSVFAETEKAIYTLQLQDEFEITHSLMEMTFKKDNRKILFRGLDDVQKLHSIIVPNGTITDIEIEEATETNEDAYEKLDLRMRGKSLVVKRMCLYFNPVFRTHWIARKWFKGQCIKYKYDGDILIVHSTYKDNKFLDDQDIKKIESKEGYYKQVFAKGMWGVLGNLIFPNFEIRDLSGYQFENNKYGLDFGFANDPSAVAECNINKEKKILYLTKELYEYGATNDVLAVKAKPIVGDNPVWCDCAEPKSIRELRNQGENRINAYGVSKGKDSVWHSLQWLQQFKWIIDKKCTNMINEVSQYQWKKNKEGISINEPVEKDDHLIAATRYATERDRLGSGVSIVV